MGHCYGEGDLAVIERRVDEWLSGFRSANPDVVADVQRGEPSERRWYVRMRGEESQRGDHRGGDLRRHELGVGVPLAGEQQVQDTCVGPVRDELLDRIAAVLQHAGITIYIGDFRFA